MGSHHLTEIAALVILGAMLFPWWAVLLAVYLIVRRRRRVRLTRWCPYCNGTGQRTDGTLCPLPSRTH